MNTPKLFDSAVSAIGAAVCFALVWGVPARMDKADMWWRFLLVFVGIVLLSCSFVNAVNYIAYHAALRTREINRARLEPAIALANAVKGLSTNQTELIARHDIPELVRQYTGSRTGIVETLMLVNGTRIHIDFVRDILIESEKRPGYLWPVREHDVFNSKGWTNTEQYCRGFTDSLVAWGMVRKAVGNNPAELLWSIDAIAERLAIDL